jgi:hypothetical protein
MTERGKHLEEALRGCAEAGVPQTGDPWPAVRERVAGKAPAGPRPSRRTGLSPGRRLILTSAAIFAVLFGSAAYAASVLTGEESAVTIERAALQSGPSGSEIVVQVRVSGEANNPRCVLLQGSPRAESTWLDDDLTELRALGDTSVYTYFEDRNMSDGSVDTSRTPLYVQCDAGTGPGGTGPGGRADEAHVAGTAEPATEPGTQKREFVRKDMSSPAIKPPTATLSYAGTSANGTLGPYCWSPGTEDAGAVLWCWNKAEAAVPATGETIRVPAGSRLDLRFGGEPGLDSVIALPQRLTGGNPANGVPGGKLHGTLRVERVGDRLEIPVTLTAGEYLVGVDVEGLDGEAHYFFRVDVTKR